MTTQPSYRTAVLLAVVLGLGLFTATAAVAQPGQNQRPGQGQGPGQGQEQGQPEAIDTGENYSVDFRGCGQVRFLPDDPAFDGTIDTNVSVLNTTANNTTTFNLSFTSDDLDNQDRLKFSTDHAAALLDQNRTSVNGSELANLTDQTNATNLTNTTNATNATNQTNLTDTTNATNATNQTNETLEELKIVGAVGIANPNECATAPNNGETSNGGLLEGIADFFQQ